MLAHSHRLWLLALPLGFAVTLSLLFMMMLSPAVSAGQTPFSVETTGIRYVDTGGVDGGNDCTNSTSPCATIQHAIDLALTGEEIRVAAGTYDQVQVKTTNQGYTLTQVAFFNKGLTLRGGFTTTNWNTADPINNLTILDAQGHGRGVSIFDNGNDPVTIDGFTITNGDYTGLGNPDGGDNQTCNRAGEDCGGGIFGKFGAIVLKNLLLTNNIASRDEGDGGGIYLISARTVTIENVQVISNSASGGGGIFVLWQNYPLSMKDSLFQDNTADYFGGLALNDFRTEVTIERTDFYSNVAKLGEAGGAYLRPAARNGNLVIDRVRLIGNQATGNGNALFLEDSTYDTRVNARLTNLMLAHNSNPAGVSASAEDAVIVVSSRFKALELVLAQVTAVDNQLGNFLFVQSNNDPGETTTVQITNTLLSGFDYAFAAQEIGAGGLILEHTNSLLYDIGTGPYLNLGGSPVFSGSGTVTGDPLLDGTYHLSVGSAAIDSGVDAGVLHDIDGDERPSGDFPDIGADEFVCRYVFLPMIIR